MRADPLLGTLLQEKYEVVRQLGQGGMGTVYEGLHTLIGRRVAIKTLHAQYAQNADVVARFRREAQAATAIGNEHIIEVTDLGKLPGGGIFLVLEYLEGTDLGALLETEGPQPVGRIAHIVSQMCEALTAAHTKGIVHRDLKPDNVFLIRRGDDPWFVKVLDFGISKFREPTGSGLKTKTGTPIGTPYFMAPEQARGDKDVDHRADIYALGVILFVGLSGQYPFEHESLAALFVKILADPVPDLAELRLDLPPKLVDLVHRMLDKDRAKRPQSCAEVRRELAPFVDRDHADAPRLRVDEADVTTPPLPSGHDATVASGESRLPSDPGASTDPVPGAEMAARVGPDRAPLLVVESSPGTPPSKRWLPLALGGVAALAVAGGFAWLALQDPGDGAATALAPVATEPTDPAPAPPEAEPASIGAAQVRVRLAVVPTDAQLVLDGAAVVAPYVRYVPATDAPHTVVVTREGYVTLERELRFDRALDETLALEREASATTEGRRRSTPRESATATTPSATTAAAREPEPPTPTTSPPSTPAPAPTSTNSTPTAPPPILPVGPAIRDPI